MPPWEWRRAAEIENDFWKIRERGGSLRSDQPGHFDLFRLATNGVEAVPEFEEWRPQLILMTPSRFQYQSV